MALPISPVQKALAVAVFVLAILPGCDSEAIDGRIDFSESQGVEAVGPGDAQKEGLVFAVSTMFAPRENIKLYQPFVDFLGQCLKMPVHLEQRSSYREVNNLFEHGGADFGFVCTGAYIEGEHRFGLEAIAVPKIDGRLTYQSVFIVPENSKVMQFEALEGKVFAFTDPLSNTGCLYPTSFLAKRKTSPMVFFSQVVYLGSHQRSVRAVAQGQVAGAAVDSLVLEYMRSRSRELGGKIREIHRSDPFGNPPAVVNPRLPEAQKDRLQEVFMGLHETPKGREILERIGVDRFVRPSRELYASARKMLRPAQVPTHGEGE
jgi:phosphonate transport system substrate-binding protein